MIRQSPPVGYPQRQALPQQFSPQGPPQYMPQSPAVQRSPQQPMYHQSPHNLNSPNVRTQPGVQASQVLPLSHSSLPQPFGGYPQQHQVERIEQPLQVVDLNQVEEPWRKKVEQLEREIARLKGQAPKSDPEEKTVYVQDDAKINDAERELSQAYAQIQQLINSIKILQEENQSLIGSIDDKKRQIADLEEKINQKDQELQEDQNIIDDLNAQLDDISSQTEEKNSYLITEVNTWKQKFIELNREFHSNQEQLMLVQAELDNIKNSSTQTTKITESKTTKSSRH